MKKINKDDPWKEKRTVEIDKKDLHKLINRIDSTIQNLELIIKKLLNYINL